MTDYNNIPPEMKALDQWVFYKKGDKRPWNPRNNQPASVSDSRTWGTFKQVVQAVKDYRGEGPGFVFTENDPYCAIDIDKCIDEDGQMDPEAQEIIDRLDSYTEVSLSGRGIHIIGRGKKPTNRCRRGNVEIYDKSRYFALTGNLWQGRKETKDIQGPLGWLCEETFGGGVSVQGGKDVEAEPVSDLVLDPNAEPPADKFDVLMKDRLFAKTWKRQREEFKSQSEYDLSLAGFAVRRGWSDQEAANLIIAHRRKHGDESGKALRQDYIRMTLEKVKPKADDEDVLSLLPCKVVSLRQIGIDDSDYELVLDSGEVVRMGNTEMFLQARKARARLYDHSYELSDKAMKRWPKIVMKLRELVEIKDSVTREDTTKSWLEDYISTRISMPRIEDKGDITEIFGSGQNSMATDKKGRLYLRLSDITRYARVHTGLPNVSVKTVAHDLLDLKFEKQKVDIKEEGRRKQISLWVSKPGFIREGSV